MQNKLEALIPDRNWLMYMTTTHESQPEPLGCHPTPCLIEHTVPPVSITCIYGFFSCLHSSQLDNRELSLEIRRGRLLSITEHRHRLSKEKTLHQHVTPGWREKMGSKVPCPWKGLNTDLQIQRLMCLPQDNHAHTNKLWQVHTKVSHVPFHYFSDVW